MQSAWRTREVLSVNVPGGHGWSVLCTVPGGQKCPSTQSVSGSVNPSAEHAMPGVHGRHSCCDDTLAAALYVPSGHCCGEEEPDGQ